MKGLFETFNETIGKKQYIKLSKTQKLGWTNLIKKRREKGGLSGLRFIFLIVVVVVVLGTDADDSVADSLRTVGTVC